MPMLEKDSLKNFRDLFNSHSGQKLDTYQRNFRKKPLIITKKVIEKQEEPVSVN